MNQLLQREGEGAYVVIFSLSSLTRITSWERGGDLNTYRICVIGFNFYDTLVTIQGGGVFTLEYSRVCSHTREVEFDSQHTPSKPSFDRRIVGLDCSLGRL